MVDAVSFDRLAGVLVGAACGDALGAGYEFGPPLPADAPVHMWGQGPFAPGEWTDDTAQLLAIAMAAGAGHDLTTPEGEDAVAANLVAWYLSPAREKDIGIHSAQVFGAVATFDTDGLAARFRAEAAGKEARQPGRSGGNGALMRTAAVAMALHHDPEAMVRAAMRLASMTHADERSSQACAIWCLAIRQALIEPRRTSFGTLDDLDYRLWEDIRRFLPDDAGFWHDELRGVGQTSPADHHRRNGHSVVTLKAALAAVYGTPIDGPSSATHLRRALVAAVRGGGDTDTVACVAGALLGAMWGYSAIPLEWRRRVFGWPGYRDGDLLRVADAVHRGGRADADQWPHAAHVDVAGWSHTDSVAVHPHDEGVVLGGFDVACGRVPLPGGLVDAVVSLCRVGRDDVSALGVEPGAHVEVRLIDSGDAADNPHLRLVMHDAADTVAALRAEGRRVLLHCVAAQSRTPSVAAHYAVRHLGVAPDRALREVCAALPAARPNPVLADVVRTANVRPMWDN